MTTTVLRRVLGVAFLGVLIFSLWLTYAAFNKTFSDTAEIRLQTSHIGLQLTKNADVKLRGMIVGEVRDVHSEGKGATVDLAIERESLDLIPKQSRARILPKTLFGEKFVDLVAGRGAPQDSLSDGDTISRDRSKVGIELERVLEDLYPLLRTVKPAELNATLNALSTALEGRGERLGDNLDRLGKYLTKINPQMPTLTEDLRMLGDVARIYHNATPDLVRLLDNVAETGDTVVVKRRELRDFLSELSGASNHTRRVLDRNEEKLIRLGDVSRPTLELLEEYSPEYPCLLEGMSDWIPRFEDSFGGGEHYSGSAPSLHIDLEIVPQNRGYDRSDVPEFADDSGPGCQGLPDPPYDQENKAPPGEVDDGVGDQPGPGVRNPVFQTSGGYVGSTQERRTIKSLLSGPMGTKPEQVPDVGVLLFAPLARGTAVTTR